MKEENKNKTIINDSENQIQDEIVNDLEFIETNEEGESLLPKDTIKKLKEEIKNLKKEKEEYLTGWQRAKADYINLQKEYGDSHARSSVLVKERFLKSLLAAIDSFDIAFKNKESWEKVDKNWRVGVEYIYQQLMTGLSDEGIDKIDDINASFDPKIHESVDVVETKTKEQDHKIADIIQVGYKIGSRVIRPARINIFEYKD